MLEIWNLTNNKEVTMAEKKDDRVRDRRTKERRRPLTEQEFKRVVDTGKVLPGDRREWLKRRKEQRRENT
jgi:hypothetical protein